MKLLKLAPVSLGLLDVASAAVDHFLPAKEFAAILKPKVAARDLVYSKAISILEAMDDSPSCARVATDNLIGDCQALNAPDAASVKQTYSMRLAMCELKEGGKWPRQCKVFLPTREGCTENCFVSPTPRQTKDCLQKLGETPQFWTSFSNAGHGAVAVCEASRWENRQGMKGHDSQYSLTRCSGDGARHARYLQGEQGLVQGPDERS
ncbi:hypothetical protein EJ06DRAFT_94440 [Trichodelitschia bisporula]|uniref:Secreted protein n=1 Tax=Trichodelitschia bisporula TaxID=703511 RepID=A0A6G1HSC3_9PEZI|nr:hypothetical protein EJ06DRAFT_94440 [Trichodelitschia bisporula]